MVEIIFRQQVHPEYSLAACIQMISGTEANQQDIYFWTLRYLQSMTVDDCFTKRDVFQKLLEESLRQYQRRKSWTLSSALPFSGFPGLALIKAQKKESPAIIISGENSKVLVYDPANEEPMYVAKIKIKNLISSYFVLS